MNTPSLSNTIQSLRQTFGLHFDRRTLFAFALGLTTLTAVTGLSGCGEKEPQRERRGQDSVPGPRLSDLPPGIFDQLQDPATAPPPLRDSIRAVVKLERPAAGILGTGFFLGDGSTLVTNAHVLGPRACLATGCTIRLHVGQYKNPNQPIASTWITLVPFAYSEDLDLAAFKSFTDRAATQSYVHPWHLDFDRMSLQRAAASTRPGVPVALVGHPLGFLLKVTQGRLASVSGPFVSSELLTFPGTSGGPILNLEGQFLALHHRGTQKLEYLRNTSYFGISLATQAKEIARAFESAERNTGLSPFQKPQDITTDALAVQYAEALVNGTSDGAPVLKRESTPNAEAEKPLSLGEKLWDLCVQQSQSDVPNSGSESPTASETPSLCTLAVRTLSCLTQPPGDPLPEPPQHTCLTQPEREEWNRRFQAREERKDSQGQVLGSPEGAFFWKVTAPLQLLPSPVSTDEVRAVVDQWISDLLTGGGQLGIDQAVTVMDLTRSQSIKEQNLSSWFLNFRSTENYYYAYSQFLRGLFVLGRDGHQPADQVRDELQRTRSDPYATVLDALLADYLDWRMERRVNEPIRGALSDSVYGLP